MYTYSGSIGGTGQLVEGGFGNGTLTLTGANSYSGSTSLNGAVTLQIGNGGGGASLASPIVYMNSASGSLIFNHSDSLTYSGSIAGAGSLTQQGGGSQLILTGSNTYSGKTTISDGTLAIGNGGSGASLASTPILDSATLVFNHNDSLTYSGSIAGTGQLVQQGTGSTQLILTGANSYSGSTTISAGTLAIGNGGSGESLASTPILDSATLIFNHNDTLTYSGSIGGTGQLVKQGTGNLILTSNNGYTGLTTVSGGTLSIGNGGNLPSLATSSILDNATVLFNCSVGGIPPNFNTAISGSGQLVQQATGSTKTVIYSGALTYTGSTTISSGVAQFGYTGGSTTPLASQIILDNGTLQFGYTSPVTYSGSIGGTGNVNMNSASMLTLTATGGPNTYTGGTSVSAGTLQLGSTTAVGTGTMSISLGGSARSEQQ